MDYNAPSGSTDANAGYVGKTASTIGSKVPPRAAEHPQREIVHAIKAAGLTPAGNDLTQLIQAATRGIWLGTFGGTANALAGTMPGSAAGVDPVLIPQLQPGMRVRGIAAYANTSATPKVTLTGIGSAGTVVQFPIVAPDGASSIPVPAWKAGQFLTFDIDASGNARFGGPGNNAPSPILVTQSPTFWIRLDGNDTNDGSANDAGHAFATIAGALAATTNLFTTAAPIILRLGQTNTTANPYAAPNGVYRLGGGGFLLLGDVANQGGYIISGAGTSAPAAPFTVNGCQLQISGVTIINTGAINDTVVAQTGSTVTVDHVTFLASTTNANSHITANGGNVGIGAGVIFAASMGSWVKADGGAVTLSGGGQPITFSPAPTWSGAGAVAINRGLIKNFNTPFSGSAAGPRYYVDTNSVIQSSGYTLPGSTAGSSATGGQYV